MGVMSTLRARDVVAFGQEIGRVLSDGQIIGRAEPYAKVFPSSREVKRAVGVVAWAVLEDIALDARIDSRGRLVATTNVRRIADNLGMSKNAVTKHLARLRDHGFVLHEEQRHAGSGRYLTSWYILDPSACIERFTTTPPTAPADDAESDADGLRAKSGGAPFAPWPTNGDTDPDQPCPTNGDTERGDPCPMIGDTAERPAVSHVTGHREMGQNRRHGVVGREEQHHGVGLVVDDGELLDRVVAVGIDPAVADRLLADHGREPVQAALQALPWHRVRNPAGWLLRAVQEGWQLTPRDSGHGLSRPPLADADSVEPAGLAHDSWAAFAVAVLDPRDLAVAVDRVTRPVAGVGRRSLPMVIAQLGAWAAHAFVHAADATSLRTALVDQLEDAVPVDSDRPLSCVERPDVDVPIDWMPRLRAAMTAVAA
jgi:DNA-binding transcriptional ArsR family regulator